MDYYRMSLDLPCTKSETIFELYRADLEQLQG